ncbi:discoidin domain-containing protein [Brevibacillus laterosporus]|uniref:discoidin domain-containing protein n=1 Tax=Brevibacillus laterosporus TaxID=1465 RepID=UPI002E1D9BB4|nr:discoidin domain-containing protein [Brevibacillus laterosporus]
MFLSKFKNIILIVFAFAIVLSGQHFVFAEEQYSENLIPLMTSDTDPEGIASSSEIGDGKGVYAAYKVFDHTNETIGWAGDYNLNYGWIAYEFPTKTVVNKYTLQVRPYKNNEYSHPKDWTFEGWDGDNWIILDQQSGILDWNPETKKEFTFNNDIPYKKYRLNVTETRDPEPNYLSLGEMEMMQKISSTPNPDPQPEPNPDPNPDPNPEPTGNGALILIHMVSGEIKEYDMSSKEVVEFIDWYEGRAKGNGKEAYIVNKKYNIGPFNSRKDFISYSHIESFEVQEYSR